MNVDITDIDFKNSIPMADIHKEKWLKHIDTTCIALEVDDCEMREELFEKVFNKHLENFKSINPIVMNEGVGIADDTFYDLFVLTYAEKWDEIKIAQELGDEDEW